MPGTIKWLYEWWLMVNIQVNFCWIDQQWTEESEMKATTPVEFIASQLLMPDMTFAFWSWMWREFMQFSANIRNHSRIWVFSFFLLIEKRFTFSDEKMQSNENTVGNVVIKYLGKYYIKVKPSSRCTKMRTHTWLVGMTLTWSWEERQSTKVHCNVDETAI
jgi:hypothetical protein